MIRSFTYNELCSLVLPLFNLFFKLLNWSLWASGWCYLFFLKIDIWDSWHWICFAFDRLERIEMSIFELVCRKWDSSVIIVPLNVFVWRFVHRLRWVVLFGFWIVLLKYTYTLDKFWLTANNPATRHSHPFCFFLYL